MANANVGYACLWEGKRCTIWEQQGFHCVVFFEHDETNPKDLRGTKKTVHVDELTPLQEGVRLWTPRDLQR